MNKYINKIKIFIIFLIAVFLFPDNVYAKDVYDIVLFWGQSNMVGVGRREGENEKDHRADDKASFSKETGIDMDIIDNYTKMNHVDVPVVENTVYDYTYDYDAKKSSFTAIKPSTVNIGKTIYIASVSNNKPVFSSTDTGTFAVQRSYGTQMSPYFGKVWYEKTGHKLVIVLAANRGESISHFLPHGSENSDNQYIYEAMKDIYGKAVSYVTKKYGTASVGRKFYVVFQGESDIGANKREHYKDTFLKVHNNLKNDLGMEFGVIVETSSKLVKEGRNNPTGVNYIHKVQEQIIKEKSDIILGSSFSYDNYNSIIDGDSVSLKKAFLSRYQLNDNDFGNSYHFNAAALSQIGKESATNAAKHVLSQTKVKVIFHKNDGSDTVAQQSFEVGNTWNPETKTGNKFGYNVDGSVKWDNTGQFGRWDRENYKLLGWNFSPDDTEAKYSAYSNVSDSWIKKYSPEVNLYAIWKKKEKQVISFNDSSITKTYGSASFINAANLTTGNGTITYKSSNTGVATVNSTTGKVTIKSVGTTTITATASETSNYSATSTNYTLKITKANSEIVLAENSSEKTYGDAAFYITITRQTGDGSISYTSSNNSAATVSNDGLVTIAGAGTTKITVKKTSTTNYNEATAIYNLTVHKAPQTMKYKVTEVNKVYGDENFVIALSSVAGNGNITYTSSNTSVATINGSGSVTIVGVGETIVTATIASTNNYASGTASYKLKVAKANQKLKFSSNKITKKTTDNSFTKKVTQSVGDGTINYQSSNTGVATVDNNGVVTINSAGTTVITATASSTNVYNEASASYTLIVANEEQKIIFAETEIVKTYGDSDFDVNPTVFIDNATITYSSSNTSVATVNNNGKVSIVGVGTTNIIATVNPNSTSEKDKAEITLIVNKANQEINFLETEVYKKYTDADFSVQANLINVKGTVTYSSDNSNVATVDNTGKVHIVGIGNVTITVMASETANYKSASDSYSLIVEKINQRISFSESSITKTFGDASFTNMVNVLVGNGSITYRSSNTSIASVDNNGKVTILGAGTITITATINATANYNEAKASYVLVIHKADQSISFTNTSIVKKLDDDEFTVQVVVSSGNGEITYESSNEKVAVVDDNGLVKILNKGSTTITATANATNNYNSTSASYSLNVLESPQTISFEDTSVTVTYGDDSPVVALDHSLGDGTVSYESSNEDVATIDENGTITITGAGETVITAIAAGTDKFDRTEACFSLIVKKGKQEIKLQENEITKKVGSDLFKIDIDDQLVKGEIVFLSEDENIARINDDNYIELLNEGETNIIVKALETDDYDEAVSMVRLRVEGRVDNKVVETVEVQDTFFNRSKTLIIISVLLITIGIAIVIKMQDNVI